MNNFRCGDIVSLRSGGPHMTVSDINENSVICMYYNMVSGGMEKATFFYQMLRPGTSAPTNPEGVTR